MKRLGLIQVLERTGCEPVRHGANHDWYRNPNTGVAQAVPRHRDVNDRPARQIIKKLGKD